MSEIVRSPHNHQRALKSEYEIAVASKGFLIVPALLIFAMRHAHGCPGWTTGSR
jgi:hypothetical protein